MKYTKDIFSKNREKVVIDNPRAPYHRCYRPFVERSTSWSSLRYCLNDDGYAERPYFFTKAFLLLQKEMEELFTYVEASYNNRNTYSYRIQQLFIRVCIELEANFKAIMSENKYSKDSNWWDINDYWKINASHKLSEYKVYMPNWEGNNKYFEPFAGWRKSPRLAWYRAFQRTKHNRAAKLYEANLLNLMNAFCGLFVVLSAQFGDEDYVTGPTLVSVSNRDTYYGCDFGIGDMLKAEYPEWSEEEKYDIDWAEVCESPDRFRSFDYDAIEDYVADETGGNAGGY